MQLVLCAGKPQNCKVQPKGLQFVLSRFPARGGCRNDLKATALKRKKPPEAHGRRVGEGKEKAGHNHQQSREEQPGGSASRKESAAAPSQPPRGSGRDTPSHPKNELSHPGAESRLRCSRWSRGRAVAVRGRAVPGP